MVLREQQQQRQPPISQPNRQPASHKTQNKRMDSLVAFYNQRYKDVQLQNFSTHARVPHTEHKKREKKELQFQI